MRVVASSYGGVERTKYAAFLSAEPDRSVGSLMVEAMFRLLRGSSGLHSVVVLGCNEALVMLDWV